MLPSQHVIACLIDAHAAAQASLPARHPREVTMHSCLQALTCRQLGTQECQEFTIHRCRVLCMFSQADVSCQQTLHPQQVRRACCATHALASMASQPLHCVSIGQSMHSGGQFMRAVLERCQHTGPRLHKLITMGAQHQGIMNVPECWNPSFNATPAWPFCSAMQHLLGWGAYLPWVRSHIIQAQYFKVG